MLIDNHKFKNKFLIKSHRLENWDYSSIGHYFVTICAKDKKSYFGKMIGEKVELSKIGEIAKEELLKTEKIRKNLILDEYVIMPNHIHIIFVIDNVETHCNASLPKKYKNQFGPQKNNLSSIIRGLKSSVKRICNKNGYNNFEWQKGYYDHIIKDEEDLYNVRNYVKYNHLKHLQNKNEKWDL